MLHNRTEMLGWIKLHRQITENEFYFSEKFTKVQAWIDLLLSASHKERTVYLRGVQLKLKPGQLCYSQVSLAQRWQWNFKSVKKFLKVLENHQMVETKTSNVTTVITIKNWYRYQASGVQNGGQKDCKMETNKNDKKIYSPTSDDVRLSKLLFELIRVRNPNHKQRDINKWSADVDKMIRLDNRDVEDIEEVIRWCQADDFWQNNILSTQKLRKQFDQLIMKMISEKNEKQKSTVLEIHNDD